MSNSRWAIYFIPRQWSCLDRFGRAWYGDGPPRLTDESGLNADVYRCLTARPRQYGFHATLKAPFRLAVTETENSLGDALAAQAARFRQFEMPPLKVAMIGNFLALVSSETCVEANALAAACTTELDHFRAPQTDAEYDRRKPERLSSRQRGLLRLWGYPYVLEEYRWHMTLTDRMDNQMARPLRHYLEQAYISICDAEPAVIDGVSLVVQPTVDAPFELVTQVPLGPSGAQSPG